MRFKIRCKEIYSLCVLFFFMILTGLIAGAYDIKSVEGKKENFSMAIQALFQVKFTLSKIRLLW